MPFCIHLNLQNKKRKFFSALVLKRVFFYVTNMPSNLLLLS
ncbi:hypothetical protein QY97_02609 [Bacillus thermotolerans]|nr:hypothetical protein QY97_02609 [Bacillus thermotolerans]